MDRGDWLRSLGLKRYEAAFRENEIDDTVLPNLTAEDLKDLGVSIEGHRRKLFDAIAAPRPDMESKAVPAAPKSAAQPIFASAEAAGERRYLSVMFCDLVDSTGIAAKLCGTIFCFGNYLASGLNASLILSTVGSGRRPLRRGPAVSRSSAVWSARRLFCAWQSARISASRSASVPLMTSSLPN